MDDVFLFTDGSVNTKTKTGYGAYLILRKLHSDYERLRDEVNVHRFENTSSTKLELQTLLYVLELIGNEQQNITVFTDSQNITGLLSRREKLTVGNFRNKKNKLIKNHNLYKLFFDLTDRLNIEFIKIKGHQQSAQKNEIDRIFEIVDKAARKALRNNYSRN